MDIMHFIEFKDVGATNGWRMSDGVPASEIVRPIAEEWPLEPANLNYSGEIASRYGYVDGKGEISIIASVTQAFCAACARARLSVDGKPFTCLFGKGGNDLSAMVRGGASDKQVSEMLHRVWSRRRDRYSELRSAGTANLPKVEMSSIGG